MSATFNIVTEHPVEGVSEPIEVDLGILDMSEYFKNSIVDNNVIIDTRASIRKHIIEIVVGYCNYHIAHPDSDDNTEWFMGEFSSSWDTPTLLRVIRASDYLHITPLYKLAIDKLNNILRGMKIEDVRPFFLFKEGMSEEDKIP